MLTDIELLRKLDFFAPLDQKIIKRIAKMCIPREFATGDFIVRRGEAGLGLYFIMTGRAKVEIEHEGVRHVVAELQDGDFLGELSMLDNQTRSADVVCTSETNCLLLTRDSFTKLLDKYPQISIQMAKALVGRVRATNERVTTSASAAASTAAPVGPVDGSSEAASSNGDSGFPAQVLEMLSSTRGNVMEMYSSTKNKTRDMLVDIFSSLYLLKIMTRFSTAIVGCPVEVEPERSRGTVFAAEICGVKLAMFPAAQDQALRVSAYADGEYSAAVFLPQPLCGTARPAVSRFQGRVRKNEVLRLRVPAAGAPQLEPAKAKKAPGTML